MCRFFGFKSCSITTFMILLKLHVQRKSGSRVKCKNALGQSDCRIFKLSYLKNYWRFKVDFLHAGTYLLKVQIDDMILGGRSQVCPGMPKEAIKTQRVRCGGGGGVHSVATCFNKFCLAGKCGVTPHCLHRDSLTLMLRKMNVSYLQDNATKAVLKYFAIFAGKHLCHSLVFKKAAVLSLQLY